MERSVSASRWSSWLVAYRRAVTRHAGWVLLLAFFVTAASVYVIVTRASVDTKTSNLLSSRLRFHALNRRFERLFPQQHEAVVLVLHGPSARRVDRAAARLLAWLRRHPHEYRNALDPDIDPFLRRAALLYLPVRVLKRTEARLIRAGPILGRLAQRPTLVGFTELLRSVVQRRGFRRLKNRFLPPVLDRLSRAVRRLTSRRAARVHWARVFLSGALQRRAEEARTIVTVRPRARPQDLRPYHDAIVCLRHALVRLGIDQAHGFRVGWTGGAVLADEQLATVGRGLAVALGLSFLIVLVLVALAVRSLRLTAAIVLTLVMGLVWTTALATLALGPFNLISVAFAVLFVGLGVDFGIQYGSRYLEEYSEGQSVTDALDATVRGLAWPLALAAIAAAISFYSFLPTRYSGIIDLGLVAGSSMFVAWLAYITLMPAWIRVMGRTHRRPPLPRNVTRYYAAFVRRNSRPILAIAVVLALMALPFSFRIRFDFNPLHLMNSRSPAVRTFDRLAAHARYSPYSISLLVHGSRRARLMARRLRDVPSVGRVLTLGSLIPTRQKRKQALLRRLRTILPPFALRPDRRRYRTVAADAEKRLRSDLAAVRRRARTRVRSPRLRRALLGYVTAMTQYLQRRPDQLLGLQRVLLGGLVENLDFLRRALRPPLVTPATLPRRLTRLFRAPNGVYRLEIFSRLDLSKQSALRRFVRQVRHVAPDAVGTPVMLVQGGQTVLHAFEEATGIALVLVAVLLYVVLRRLRDVALILANTLVCAVLSTATMVFLHQSYNLANIIVLPLLLGLSLVYGIYFILRWRDGTPIERILRSSTPRGILYSGATTLGTFGTLTLASDPGVDSLGRALVVVLTWVLVSTLLLLPALLVFLPPRPSSDVRVGYV
jgi:hopanoid biosynthesis associated RND transporter like protein HpnN